MGVILNNGSYIVFLNIFFFQRKERAEQIAYKLEQDLALCKYVWSGKYWSK